MDQALLPYRDQLQQSYADLIRWLVQQPEQVNLIGNIFLTPSKDLTYGNVRHPNFDLASLIYESVPSIAGFVIPEGTYDKENWESIIDDLYVNAFPQAIPVLLARMGELRSLGSRF